METIKVIIFDGDDVVINKPRRFSEIFSEEYNVPYERILPFFENEFQKCEVGQADLKQEVAKYIGHWNWPGTVNELLGYWFEKENYVDQQLVDKIQEYRSKGIRCYLASNQEAYHTAFLDRQMGLGQVFDGIFTSASLGVKKPEQLFWTKVFERIQPAEKSQVLVWDDKLKMVESAQRFGFKAKIYESLEEFIKTMALFNL